jgi:Spy/CpxP family protein refolding chaperone
MKKIVMMMAALTIAAAGFGQHRPMHRSHHRADAMTQALGLDSAQSAAIKSINRKYHQQVQQLKGDTSRAFDTKKDELKSLRDTREQEIDKVLTAEQRKKRETLQAERVEKRHKAMEARRDSHDERIKSKLSIDDKKLEEMRKARKESFSAAQVEYEKKLKTILTKEQFDEWKEMQDNRKKAQHRSR